MTRGNTMLKNCFINYPFARSLQFMCSLQVWRITLLAKTWQKGFLLFAMGQSSSHMPSQSTVLPLAPYASRIEIWAFEVFCPARATKDRIRTPLHALAGQRSSANAQSAVLILCASVWQSKDLLLSQQDLQGTSLRRHGI